MRPDDGRAIPAFLGQALSGRPLTVAGDGSQTRSICYVDDTVRGILAMAFSHEAGPVNIGNPDELSMLELARWIVELTGSSSEISFIDLPVDDPKVRRPDTRRAEEHTSEIQSRQYLVCRLLLEKKTKYTTSAPRDA